MRALILLTAVLSSGCMMGRQHPAATQPATAADSKTTLQPYWLDQPGIVHVTARSFDALWNACREAAIADGFLIDRTDYREGLLTTQPLVSKSVFELWRNDVVSGHELAESTFGSLRRTVHFTIRRLPDGRYQVTPKVLVERYSAVERRITSVAQYADVFSIRLMDVNRETEATGELIPAEYWYSIGRDHTLEKQLADSIRFRLHVPR